MRRYVQAFFRHPLLLTMPIIIAVTISLGYEVRLPRTFSANASMWCDVPVPNQSSIFSGTSELPSASQSVVLTELLQTREFLSKVGQSSPWAGYLAAHPEAVLLSIEEAAAVGKRVAASRGMGKQERAG